MDLVTYAAASMKSFDLYLGEMRDLPDEAIISLTEEQAKQIEQLIKSQKPFVANLSASGLNTGDFYNDFEKINLCFFHSMVGCFFSNFWGMDLYLIYSPTEHSLYFSNPSASSTYSMRNQNPTVKEVFEAVVERAKEYGVLK